jgi:hypothetical protein
MKKTLTVIALLAGVVSGHSQGSVSFYLNNAGNMKQSVWNTQTSGDNTTITYGGYGTNLTANGTAPTIQEEQGSTSAANETPAGTTVYATGTALGGTAATGSLYDVQLLAGAGSGLGLNQLVPTGGILNFFTTAAAAGQVSGAASDSITGTTVASPVATVAVAAWANGGGLYSTLASAVKAGEPWGISPLANITTAFSPNPATGMNAASDLSFSFSLGTPVTTTPEPSTIALGVMGASALLFRRRK